MMKGFQMTDIGYIPNDWRYGRIDGGFSVQQGKQVSKVNRVGNNQKPFLRTSNLLWGKVILKELDYMHFSKEEENKFKLELNDVLVCEGGDIGRTAIWKEEIGNCYYQNHLHRLRSKTKEINPEFVLFWMHYSFLYAKLYFGRGNITTIPNLSKSRLSEFTIPIPPLPEQRKIAYVLSSVQKVIEQQDKLIKTTTELKKALMQKLFTEGTKGEKQKQTEIGPIPESWEVVEFPKFALLQRGKDLTKDNFKKGDFPVAGSNGIIGYHNEFFVKAPCVTIGRSGTCGKPQYYESNVWAHNTSLYVKNFFENNEKFTFYYLQYLDLGRFKTGASVPTLDRNSLNTLLIGVPSKTEQVEVVKTLTTLDEKLHFNQEKKQALTDLFKTLLHELMTGQRRVHEIDFEGISRELEKDA